MLEIYRIIQSSTQLKLTISRCMNLPVNASFVNINQLLYQHEEKHFTIRYSVSTQLFTVQITNLRPNQDTTKFRKVHERVVSTFLRCKHLIM